MKRTLWQDVLLWKKNRYDDFANLRVDVALWLLMMFFNHVSLHIPLVFVASAVFLTGGLVRAIASFLSFRRSIKDMSQAQLEVHLLAQKIYGVRNTRN